MLKRLVQVQLKYLGTKWVDSSSRLDYFLYLLFYSLRLHPLLFSFSLSLSPSLFLYFGHWFREKRFPKKIRFHKILIQLACSLCFDWHTMLSSKLVSAWIYFTSIILRNPSSRFDIKLTSPRSVYFSNFSSDLGSSEHAHLSRLLLATFIRVAQLTFKFNSGLASGI